MKTPASTSVARGIRPRSLTTQYQQDIAFTAGGTDRGLDSTKIRRVATGFGRGKTYELNTSIHSSLFDDCPDRCSWTKPQGRPAELAQTNLRQRQPKGVTLGLDASQQASRSTWKERERLHDTRERTTELLAHDVHFGDAELALFPATPNLGKHGLELLRDLAPRTQPAACTHQRELLTHVRAKHVEPSIDLVDDGLLVLLQSNETVERVAREPAVSPCGPDAVEQTVIGPTLHARGSDADDTGGLGCAEQLGHYVLAYGRVGRFSISRLTLFFTQEPEPTNESERANRPLLLTRTVDVFQSNELAQRLRFEWSI